MNAEDFVKAFYKEKQRFLKEYVAVHSKTEVGQLIASLHLNDQQSEIMKKIVDTSLTDIFYTILLGLDGCASIGGIQQQYDLKDEHGNKISGEIEEYAYIYFQK